MFKAYAVSRGLALLALAILPAILLASFPLEGGALAALVRRVIVLESMEADLVRTHTRMFRAELIKLAKSGGYRVKIEVINARGDFEKAGKRLADALSKGEPDLVVANATLASTVAIEVLGGKVPILFMTVSDPVGAGLIKEVGKPSGTNVTGVVHTISRGVKVDMVGGLLGERFPGRPLRAGFIYSSYPSSEGDLRELANIASARGDIVFVPYRVEYMPGRMADMVREAVRGRDALRGKVDFLWSPQGPLGESPECTRALLEGSDLPMAVGTTLKSVELGALLSLCPDPRATARKAAAIADAVLRGKAAGSIAAEPPDGFNLGINLATARRMGVVIPAELIELAGRNIYR